MWEKGRIKEKGAGMKQEKMGFKGNVGAESAAMELNQHDVA